MKKIFSVFIIISVMMFSTACFASMFDDLRNNPNYIYCGHTGSGFAIFLDKTSINVHEYNPPYYTIAFIRINWASTPPMYSSTGEVAKPKVQRYHYDYDTRKIYKEDFDINNNAFWEYVDPVDYSKTNGGRSILAEAELVFYLAYNMSFFDKPSSKAAEYINSHK